MRARSARPNAASTAFRQGKRDLLCTRTDICANVGGNVRRRTYNPSPPVPGFGALGRDMTVKLVLVDNHRLFREGMRSLISTQSDMQVVGEASQAPEAHGIIDQARPDVLLLEISPQGGGISIAQEILRQHPQQRILVLSMFSDEEHLAQALTAGVAGYAL